MRAAWLLGLAALGCGTEPGVWLVVQAPLEVPRACDGLSIAVTRRTDGVTAFQRTLDLSSGPVFPVTYALDVKSQADLDVPLTVAVTAFRGGALATPWAQASGTVTVPKGKVETLTVKICDCFGR